MGFVILGGLGWLLWEVLAFIWGQFVSLKTELAVAILTAAATVLTATGTLVVGRILEGRQQSATHFREKKTEIYDEFLKEFFAVFYSGGQSADDALVGFLREWQRKLIAWGGPDVMIKFLAWKAHLEKTGSAPDAEGFFKMGDLFLSMRSDLGLSNKGLDRKIFTHALLRNADLMLQMYAKNPKVTLAELGALEKTLGRE